MKKSKLVNYFLVITGCFVAIYAQADKKQNVIILIVGIVILMLGIFRIASTIPSKHEKDTNENDNEQ